MLPLTDFLMKRGHLLIGLSLVSGLMVRISGPFGILLMVTYHFAHMEWPFIEDHLSLFVDYHLVYAIVIVYLMAHHAGHVWGLTDRSNTCHWSRVYLACGRCSPELVLFLLKEQREMPPLTGGFENDVFGIHARKLAKYWTTGVSEMHDANVSGGH